VVRATGMNARVIYASLVSLGAT